MKQEQECPLCCSIATYTYEKTNGKTVKKILCPKCTRLVFEEDTEERVSSSRKDIKDTFISLTIGMASDQVLTFCLDRKKKSTSTGLFSINAEVVPRSDYLRI